MKMRSALKTNNSKARNSLSDFVYATHKNPDDISQESNLDTPLELDVPWLLFFLYIERFFLTDILNHGTVGVERGHHFYLQPLPPVHEHSHM